MSSLRISGVGKSFGATRVLDDVDLEVRAGDLSVLLGPSGCGKTTLLRIVAGHLAPDTGTLVVGDRIVAGPGRFVAPERRGIGIVPQDGALFPHLDVAGNIAFGLSARDRRASHRCARVRELLELVGLPGAQSLPPSQLSGGQQQRVALARALAPEPQVVLLDEPFSALDSALRGNLRADVRRALRTTGATALMVTHDQEEALSMADSVAVMRSGQIVMHDTPATVYATPSCVDVARSVGDVVELAVTGAGMTVLGQVPTGTVVPQGGGVAVLRPEHLRLSGASDPEPASGNAVVADIEYFGHDALVTLELTQAPGTRVMARTARPPTPGSEVHIDIDGPVTCFPDTTSTGSPT